MGADLIESVQFSGAMAEGEDWPVLTVSHQRSELDPAPVAPVVKQWIGESHTTRSTPGL